MAFVDILAFCSRSELRLGDPARDLGVRDAGHPSQRPDIRVLALQHCAVDELPDLVLGHGQTVRLIEFDGQRARFEWCHCVADVSGYRLVAVLDVRFKARIAVDALQAVVQDDGGERRAVLHRDCVLVDLILRRAVLSQTDLVAFGVADLGDQNVGLEVELDAACPEHLLDLLRNSGMSCHSGVTGRCHGCHPFLDHPSDVSTLADYQLIMQPDRVAQSVTDDAWS